MAAMSFELSPEHEQFRRTVRDFAEKEIAPHAAQWDRDHHFPTDVVQKMGELGLFGPHRARGVRRRRVTDGGFTSLCVAIEEIGRVDQSMGITLEAAVGLGINPILTFGTDEQKQPWLPDLVAGEKLAGFGLTEPGAGSDAGATRTKAELVGRRVGRQRRQAVHHQLRLRHHLPGHRHRAHRRERGAASPRSPRSSSRAARPASPPRRPTTSSAGTPPTPTR